MSVDRAGWFLARCDDNVGRTARGRSEDVYDRPCGEVYTSTLYLLRGALQRQDVERWYVTCWPIL